MLQILIRYPITKYKKSHVAEWLGKGLQNLLRRFESAHDFWFLQINLVDNHMK